MKTSNVRSLPHVDDDTVMRKQLITAGAAKVLFEASRSAGVNYREWRPHHSKNLLEIMKSGSWEDRGDQIRIYKSGAKVRLKSGEVIDAGGMVADGQHRLWAQWQAGLDLTLFVQYVDGDWWGDDGHRTRTYRDHLAASGETNVHVISSVCLSILRIQAGHATGPVFSNRHMLDATLEEWRTEIDWSFKTLHVRWEPSTRAGSAPVYSAFAMAHRLDQSAAESLATRCITGAIRDGSTIQDDPAHALRRSIFGSRSVSETERANVISAVVRAFRAEREGAKLGLIRSAVTRQDGTGFTCGEMFKRSSKYLATGTWA